MGENDNNESLGWRAALEPDLQKNEVLTQFKEVKELGRAHVDLTGKMKTAIFIPQADAKDEDKVAFQAKINEIRGVPQTPDKYDFAVDKKAEGYTPELEKGIRTMFHEAGVDGNQAKKLLEGFVKMGGTLAPAQAEKMKQTAIAEYTASEKTRLDKVITDEALKLKTEWGADYDTNLAIMAKAVNNIEKVVPGFKQYADESGIGNNPFLVKVFAFIGQAISEDTFTKGAPSGGEAKQAPGTLNYPSME